MDLKFILEDKLFFLSVFLVVLSVLLFCIKIPNREFYVLGAFLFFLVVSIFKFIK